ncbi:MAG: alpha/beta hydrolase [Sulfurovum sp.]|nr:alpha/beta hydrolase [Sulfurovum sp.]
MASKRVLYREYTFDISYTLVNTSLSKSILILHGWGSNKELMKQAFTKRFAGYKHIYVDMPGFGKSNNDTVLTTSDYAEIMKLFLGELGATVQIAMGHSFGGKVATLLQVPCLVLLSSAGIVTDKPWSIKLKIATVRFLKPLGMKKIRSLFVAPDAKNMSHEMYETFKNVVDEDFEVEFSKSRSKGLLFWGIDDTATPLCTGEKIAALIPDSEFYPLDGDHYFFLQHADFIEQKIIQHCMD